MLVKESEERNFTDENLEEWKKTGIIKNFQDKILDFSTLSNVDRTGWTDKLIVRDCSFKYLDISDLGLKTLEISDCPNLKELNATNNNINDVTIVLEALFVRDTVVITSRRRREVLQDVPIPISVIGGPQIEESGSFNVNRVKEFVPAASALHRS